MLGLMSSTNKSKCQQYQCVWWCSQNTATQIRTLMVSRLCQHTFSKQNNNHSSCLTIFTNKSKTTNKHNSSGNMFTQHQKTMVSERCAQHYQTETISTNAINMIMFLMFSLELWEVHNQTSNPLGI